MMMGEAVAEGIEGEGIGSGTRGRGGIPSSSWLSGSRTFCRLWNVACSENIGWYEPLLRLGIHDMYRRDIKL